MATSLATARLARCSKGGSDLLQTQSTSALSRSSSAGAPQKEKLEFLAEIQLMKDLGPHPNVIGIIGHCLKEQPFLLMVELVQHGNLRDYLRSCRPKHGAPPKLTVGDLADFSLQIASGMEFLATRNVVHRDLAARNVLVGKKHSLKISDFGLARSMEEDEYHATGMKLPIK